MMNNLSYKKMFLAAFIACLSLILASCGTFDKFCDEIDALSVNASFPQAFGGAKSLDEAEDSIREQQGALAYAYYEANKITETDFYRKKYIDIEEKKIVSELSRARREINNKNDALYADNVRIIVQNVTDLKNADVYINDSLEEVKEFYMDYVKLMSYSEDDFEEVTSILMSYTDKNNEFANWVLKDKEILIAECATLAIEKNAEATESHAAYLQKNYEIVTSINTVFGGVRKDSGHGDRINAANKKLSSYLSEQTKLKQEQTAALETQ